MKKYFNKIHESQQLIYASEFWGINFFWAKDLKFTESDLKNVANKAIHRVEVKDAKESYIKQWHLHDFGS